jgi:hypothetical protein
MKASRAMLEVRWLAGVVALLALMGCGPVQSTGLLMDAEVMLEAARTAQAERLAPYEWTAAQLYLHKSREEVGFSEFEQAVEYAKKAVDFATRARDAAARGGRRAGPAPVERPE